MGADEEEVVIDLDRVHAAIGVKLVEGRAVDRVATEGDHGLTPRIGAVA